MVTRQQFERLEPFIADDETTIDGYSTATEIGLLTDRQLITLQTADGDGQQTTVNATYLDHVGGVQLTQSSSPEFYEDKLGYGIGALVIALVSLVLGVLIDGDGLTAILLIVGIGVGVLGIVLILEAYDTPEDSVAITLQTAEGDVAWQKRLPEDYSEFVEALSRTVSTAHAVEGDVAQTVG